MAKFHLYIAPGNNLSKKPNSKIPHHSRTVRGHLRTSHSFNFTKLDGPSKIERCISFGEECMSENLGLPVAPRSISLGAHDQGSLTLVQGHHEKSGNSSCVSFWEECMLGCCGSAYCKWTVPVFHDTLNSLTHPHTYLIINLPPQNVPIIPRSWLTIGPWLKKCSGEGLQTPMALFLSQLISNILFVRQMCFITVS